MAHIVIIHVPDDHTTDAIVAGEVNVGSWGTGVRIVGLFDFPNRSQLTCRGTCIQKNSGAWRRDPLGFMKCSICGKRNRKMRQWLLGSLFDYLGANLYPEAPAAFRTPEHYGE